MQSVTLNSLDSQHLDIIRSCRVAIFLIYLENVAIDGGVFLILVLGYAPVFSVLQERTHWCDHRTFGR